MGSNPLSKYLGKKKELNKNLTNHFDRFNTTLAAEEAKLCSK